MEHFVELGNLLADQVKVLVYSRIIMLHMKPTDLSSQISTTLLQSIGIRSLCSQCQEHRRAEYGPDTEKHGVQLFHGGPDDIQVWHRP